MRPSPRVLALLVLLATAPAAAGPHLAGIPPQVTAGADLRITWVGLAADAHEAELELSLAGGRWTRISPELEAREGGFTWHVPPSLSGPARLRLRYGGEWFEAEGEVSMPFRIEGTAGPPLGAFAADRAIGEWWCAGGWPADLPNGQLTGAASLGRAWPAIAIAPSSQRSARVPQPLAAHGRSGENQGARAAPHPPRRVPRLSHPLRI
jgi:hypothetical protein